MSEFSKSSFDGTLVAISYISTLFSSLLVPIIIWVVARKESRGTEEALRNVINFSISYLLYLLISSLLMVVLIGFVLTPIFTVLYFVFAILAAIKTARGENYIPPLTIRLL